MKCLVRCSVFAWIIVAACVNARFAAAKDNADDTDTKATIGDDIYESTKVWQFEIELTAAEWDRMQPTGGGRFPGFPGPPQPEPKPADKSVDSHKSVFGMEFPWVHAALTAEGKTYANIGLRFKGNSSYGSSAGGRGLKRPLKVDLDRFDKKQRFHGEKMLNLNNNAFDPSQLRESMAYAAFRAAGVPAPRTAMVELTLHVPGKYEHEFLGMYTLIEQVDKKFLNRQFKNGKGLLMKPERMRGLEYHGEDWQKYQNQYQPNDDATPDEAARCMAFAKLINQANDEEFAKQIGDFLDIEELQRFVAVNVLVVNMDSFLMNGHNYYLYLNPKTNKFVFIPWDLNLAMAAIGMFGPIDQQMDLSIDRPYPGQNKLVDRLWAIPEMKPAYRKIVKELSETTFSKPTLLAELATLESASKELIAREAKTVAARNQGAPAGGPPGFGGPGGPGGMFGSAPPLATFIDKRSASVAAQLAGKSPGYVPVPFGPGGGGGPGIGALAKPLLMALDSDKDGKLTQSELVAGAEKFLSDFDKDKDGKLDEREIQAALSAPRPGGGGFGPQGPRPEGQRPEGARPDGGGRGERREP